LTTLLPSTRTLPLEPREALRIMKNLGFEEAELNYASFEHSGLDYPSYVNLLRLSLLEASRLGIRVPVVHAPWEEYFLIHLGQGVEKAVAEALLIAETASSYGVEILVFHPFSQRRIGSGRAWWLNRRFFSLLAAKLEDEGIEAKIAIENTNRAAPWNRVEETRRLVESAGSSRVGLCLDFGHAGVNGYTPAKALEAAGRPVCLHVHDNHLSRDEHLPPGCGGLDWESLRAVKPLAEAPHYAVVEVDCKGSQAACISRLRASYAASRVLLAPLL
jgi:sugar phosphate isomerase/epimerase